ncbi:N-acetylmuramic acid 6-phosphate etherase [Mesotoga prima MesG1.Ag.4.2]|uniref:N-acetylmuramic acid 6-phosphate etherase n=1 Tax=Mesotoga prima MesG1.Ag.4.2 TaxID=660470 RepID=I2F8F3_9BACT|nr:MULTISPECIES: N-acetylmuramic acid 6-phosphate etherase [Mesotoga]AFK08206.1 N-acetylmuramic acid 6-phosphate etherase [Mesotoga prima MesG1.Ag.4.2]PIJ61474.1 N-acetylmuramic acid-6-phosphate etherase [Mesotoga sp. H07.pep.5.3]
MKFDQLETERSNPRTRNLDELSTYEMLRIMNEEDATVPLSVREVLNEVASAVELCVRSLEMGGRIVYAGAGTSGRLGVLDAAEVVPTFGVSKDLFVTMIAGGQEALANAVEQAEDSIELGEEEAKKVDITEKDAVVGISASGRTPYVEGILKYARKQGARTILICNVGTPRLTELADVTIAVRTGPEVITGSTRLKAGTAQKMVLNMISTITMVKVGRVFGNYMIGVKILNRKLVDRATRIVSEISELSYEESEKILEASGREVPLAILMALTGLGKEKCEESLKRNRGHVRSALKELGGVS